MTRTAISAQTLTFLLLITWSALPLGAQTTFRYGGVGSYTITTAALSNAENVTTTRFSLGLGVEYAPRPKFTVLGSLQYRSDAGSFITAYQQQTTSTALPGGPIPSTGRLDVVIPPQGVERVATDINLGALELQIGMSFPIIDLDTSGARIELGLGVLGDYILSGTQVDDYTYIAGTPAGETRREYSYNTQIGGGAWLMTRVVVPLGETDRLTFGLQYVFRQPTDITGTFNNETFTQNVGWLAGRGLRLTVGYMM